MIFHSLIIYWQIINPGELILRRFPIIITDFSPFYTQNPNQKTHSNKKGPFRKPIRTKGLFGKPIRTKGLFEKPIQTKGLFGKLIWRKRLFGQKAYLGKMLIYKPE